MPHSQPFLNGTAGGHFQDPVEPLAIVGFSFRFPQDATTPDDFWRMLLQGRDCVTDFPADRLNVDAFYNPEDIVDSIPLRGGHFLKEGLGVFDAPFFSISPAEAKGLDPQHRLLLEETYRALENAGIPIQSCAGSNVSVHVGAFGGDYASLQFRDPLYPSQTTVTGNSHSFLSNRLSWFFDFKGPSVTIDTACSSSLTALDLGCKSLLHGECSMAVVAGAGLVFDLYHFVGLSASGALSPDSQSFSFDARANGYGRGEGAATVVVKRVSDAIRDGDPIRAVIRSTACNQDGHVPIISQPSQTAQRDLIRQAYTQAGLDMGLTTYFEAHATGTPVGDPIEVNAAVEAFKDNRPPEKPLYVGTLKTNVGHLEGASGIGSVIRTVLMLERGIIPPIGSLKELNPAINVGDMNVIFPREPAPWPEGIRRASVNSFGMGGSNCHVILDDAYHFLLARGLNADRCAVEKSDDAHVAKSLRRLTSQSQPIPGFSPAINGNMSQGPETVNADNADIRGSGKDWSTCNGHDISTDFNSPHAQHDVLSQRIMMFSGSDRNSIDRLTSAYADYFDTLAISSSQQETFLDRLAYTLNHRRSHLSWRSFAVIDSMDKLKELSSHTSLPCRSKTELQVAFVFTGQGAQWPKMGKELLCFPVFNESLQRAQHQLNREGAAWLLLDELSTDKSSSNLNDPAVGQPMSTALQLALVDLFRTFGVYPTRVVGHSSGEIAAAYCVGAISHESAMKIAYHRGRLTSTLTSSSETTGAMMSVGLPDSEVKPYIEEVVSEFSEDALSIGCVNSPRNVTVTGEAKAIDKLKTILDKEDVFAKKLNVTVAYHSKQMVTIAEDYRDSLKDLEAGEPTKNESHLYSSLHGIRVSKETLANRDYWVENLTNPVLFSDALKEALVEADESKTNPSYHVVEIGPTSALQRPVKDVVAAAGSSVDATYDSALRRGESATITLLHACGQLFSLGYPVSLEDANQNQARSTDFRKVLTNLPGYQFDHSKSYWHEGTLSRGYRFRKYPRVEFLGSPALDFNPKQPRWRNVIKISELPWLEDHKVNGEIVYPAAGMLVMAIEACLQISEPGRKITGIKIKDAAFKKPLNIDLQAEATETEFSLRPLEAETNKTISSFDFFLFMIKEEERIENCCGTIQLQYESEPGEGFGFGNDRGPTTQLDAYHKARAASTFQNAESQRMYSSWAKNGFHYGPLFQLLHNVYFNDSDEALADLDLEKALSAEKPALHRVQTLDSSALDALFQLGMTASTKAGQDISTTFIPTRIKSLWIRQAKLKDRNSIGAYARYNRSAKEYTYAAVDKDTGELMISIEGYKTATVSESNQDAEAAFRASQLFYKQILKPDIALVGMEKLREYCVSDINVTDPVQDSNDKAFMVMATILATLDSIKDKDLNLKPHLQKYVEWMKAQASYFEKDVLPFFEPEWRSLVRDKESLHKSINDVRSASRSGTLHAEVATNLLDILEGNVDALELLFESDLVSELYREQVELTGYAQGILRYIELLVHKNPTMKVLEVGAGTGGLTHHILGGLYSKIGESSSGPLFSQYDFTDISRSFFMEAQEEFKAWDKENFRFEIFDVEKDPASQGFENGTYDLVLAAAVLHATSDIELSLRNCSKLLKPGGKILIVELTHPNKVQTPFIWGLLEGWWSSVKEDRLSPILRKTEWSEMLSRNGFSGLDLAIDDYTDPRCQESSLLLATAVESSHIPKKNMEFSILAHTQEQKDMGYELAHILRKGANVNAGVCDLNEACKSDNWRETFFISLLEVGTPFLYKISSENYQSVQSLLTMGKQILWVTSSGEAEDRARLDMIKGLSRVLRSETYGLALITLSLEASGTFEHQLGTIIQVVTQTVADMQAGEHECEFVEQNHILQIPRFNPNKILNDRVELETGPLETKNLELGSERGLRLDIKYPGLLDTLHFVEDRTSANELQEKEIEIEACAFGMNFRDILVSLGRLQQSGTIGCEVAGKVTKVGNNSKFKVGERVTALAPNGFQTVMHCQDDLAAIIPDHLSFSEGVAIPVNFTTSYHALHELAHITSGETVLIHAAAGATGQAAIQIATYFGAEVFATVGSVEKKKLIMNSYQIPEDHIFYSRDTSFAQAIMNKTKGQGVDIVLNSLSGPALLASWECMSSYGRFIEIGKHDILLNTRLPMQMFERNVSFSAVDLHAMAKERPALFSKSFSAVMNLVQERKLHTSQPIQRFRVSELEDAFRFLQTGKSKGKVVVELDPKDIVPMTLSRKPGWYFKSDATYVLAGGWGGVGIGIIRWMTQRGAKNLLLLSRSGPSTDGAKALVDELKSLNVSVQTPMCDVSNAEQVSAAIAECQKSMPPIKGCIQASAVVQDSVFESMDYDAWNTSVDPKVQGTYNLHTLLPFNLDFFITLSSTCGVFGNHSQGNYAAGNTYQDGLALQRTRAGHPNSVSLDLSLVLETASGSVSQSAESRLISNAMIIPMRPDELHALLDKYCDPSNGVLPEDETQVVVGVQNPAARRAAGFDPIDFMYQPAWRALWRVDAGAASTAAAGSNSGSENAEALRGELTGASSLDDAAAAVTTALVAKLARALGIEEEEIDAAQPMHAYGMDSLVAVEIRNWFAKMLDAEMAVWEILSGASFAEAGRMGAARSAFARNEWAAEAPET